MEKRDFLELKVGMLSVFLSVSLSDRQNFGQQVITAEIATNTQGENKDKHSNTETKQE